MLRIWAILIGVWWYLVVLICNSQMAYDGEHLFICLFAISIYSLVRFLLTGLAHFLIGLFVLLLLSFKSSLCVLCKSPGLTIPLQIVFLSQFLAYHFILSTTSFTEQKLLF